MGITEFTFTMMQHLEGETINHGSNEEPQRGSLRDGEHRWKSIHREMFRLDVLLIVRVPCSSVDRILACEMFHSA